MKNVLVKWNVLGKCKRTWHLVKFRNLTEIRKYETFHNIS